MFMLDGNGISTLPASDGMRRNSLITAVHETGTARLGCASIRVMRLLKFLDCFRHGWLQDAEIERNEFLRLFLEMLIPDTRFFGRSEVRDPLARRHGGLDANHHVYGGVCLVSSRRYFATGTIWPVSPQPDTRFL